MHYISLNLTTYSEIFVNNVCYCRTSVSKERWEMVEGTFSMPTMPERLVFYLEGPSPGIDMLVDSVVISCSSLSDSEVNCILHQCIHFLNEYSTLLIS